MPEVSLIIPVYRVEKQLSRCLDSVMAQTFTDFEAILVDDGSPDQSGAICDMYAEKDDRFRVIHKQNGGVSSARNAGLNAACGTYVVFADSDDELEDNYLQCLMKSDADLVIAGVQNIDADGMYHALQYSACKIERLRTENITRLLDDHAMDYMCSKRFKHSVVEGNKIRFNVKMALAEDTLFVATYLCQCSTVEVLTEIPYKYFKYNSATLSAFHADFVANLKKANACMESMLDSRFHEIGQTSSWKRRCWSVYYYSIFYTLREWDVPTATKLKMLHSIFADDEFIPYSRELDYYMKDDSKLIRRLVQSRNAYLLLFAWKLIAFRTRCREKRGTSSNAKTR